MTSSQTWPSRRLQIAVIVLLVVAAAVTVFVPPLSRKKRAQQLYKDSLFLAVGLPSPSDDNDAAAVKKLESALALAPGNSLYEQSLVWYYPKNELPRLLTDRKLSPAAERLAYGIICESALGHLGLGTNAPPSKNLLNHAFTAVDELQKQDPENALPRYLKAFVLQRAGRMDDSLAEVEAGNRIGTIRYYIPHLPKSISDSLVGASLGVDFRELSYMREVARGMVDLSNKRLMERKVNDACEPLEECCRMGVNVANAEPASIIHYLVGDAVFAIGWNSLEPIYKDFGMKSKLPAYRRVEDEFGRGKDAEWNFMNKLDVSLMMLDKPFFAASIFFAISTGISISLLLLVLSWLAWSIVESTRRRKQQEALTFAPWGEGWLARTFLYVYTPILAVDVLQLILVHSLFSMSMYYVYSDLAPIILVVIAQFIVIRLVNSTMRRCYRQHTDAHSEDSRSRFRSPVNKQAWSAGYWCAVFAAQAAFLGCCLLLLIAVNKPITGMQPWQVWRAQRGSPYREASMAARLSADLMKVVPPTWRHK